MDVGQRPSRQRRHLPTNVTTLQQQGSSVTTSTKTTTTSNQQHEDDMTYSDDDIHQHYQSQQSSRVRKRVAKKRMQQNFGHWATLSKKGSTSATTQGSTFMSMIPWRVWFWRLCVLWLAFLILRIMISIWQGDTTRLGLNQYLSQLFPFA